MKNNNVRKFVRPIPERAAPNRTATNFYKSASDNPETIGGVSFNTVEDAVVSSVRMGYKIAAAQVERLERFSKRVQSAGDQAAGPESDRKAVDATEQVLFRAMMAGLSWFEGAASEPGHPLKRLAAAQYTLLGSLFGLAPPEPAGDTSASASKAKPKTEKEPSPAVKARSAPGDMADIPPAPRPVDPMPQVQHTGAVRRSVDVRQFELTEAKPKDYKVRFFHVNPKAAPIAGVLIVREKGASVLKLKLARHPSGSWKAAICDSRGKQLGRIEIEL